MDASLDCQAVVTNCQCLQAAHKFQRIIYVVTGLEKLLPYLRTQVISFTQHLLVMKLVDDDTLVFKMTSSE